MPGVPFGRLQQTATPPITRSEWQAVAIISESVIMIMAGSITITIIGDGMKDPHSPATLFKFKLVKL